MAKCVVASSGRRERFIDDSVKEYRDRGHWVTTEFVLLLAIGFVAQLVDGTLGMAYGVLLNAAMLTMGLPPAHASALVHTAEVFTTGASAASHIYHRNVDWRMVARLGVTGVGGWGPVTTSTLIGSGHAPRQTVGSVNTTEFFVTVAAAATFFAELGASPLRHLVPLVLGGVLAAPFGGWAIKHVPARALMIAVGVVIVTLSVFQLLRAFGLI
jgi:uncharacterized membrane protein YfcA